MSFWDLVQQNEEEFRFWKEDEIFFKKELPITMAKTTQETGRNVLPFLGQSIKSKE